MIHTKLSSPPCNGQRKKRRTSSGRSIIESAKTVRKSGRARSTEPEEPVPIRYADLYKREKAQLEVIDLFKKKKSFPIAPDALIPNSSCRTVFKIEPVKPVEVAAFRLRLDILENLPSLYNRNSNDDDDDWTEVTDFDNLSKGANGKQAKGTVGLRKKDNVPDLFKRMQSEPWWKQAKEEKQNVLSFVLYLIEVIKSRQNDSYGSACNYIVEIFRTCGIDPAVINQIIDLLLSHLMKDEQDPLDVHTIRTIGQFMIEQKNLIVRLLEYALKCQPDDNSRKEVINTVKFITDVKDSEDIDLILEDMSPVYNAPDENFSLKMIIQGLPNRKRKSGAGLDEDEDSGEVHPLLRKISEERWFPRGRFSITLNYVIQAIIEKLPNATKSIIKTLTSHLIQLDRVIGYTKEQFERVSNGLILLLSSEDPDYRLISATSLAAFCRETKAIVIALLNSFLNDSRILVRTECCDSLKKLTGVMSDTVLTDCANDVSHIETLPEEDFSLQNYLNEKNRVPTPPIQRQPSLTDAQIDREDEFATNDLSQSLTLGDVEKKPIESNQISLSPSLLSSTTHFEPTIRVEISGKRNPTTPQTITSQKDETSADIDLDQMHLIKNDAPDQSKKRGSILPNHPNMWDLYSKQNDPNQIDESHMNHFPVPPASVMDQDHSNDPIRRILDEHQRTAGFYRMLPNRRVLIPKKISMSNVWGDQSHIIDNQDSSNPSSRLQNTMGLSDFNQNQYHLKEVEHVQLLSSLVIRALQVHRQYERVIPGSFTGSFSDALSVTSMPLHTSPKMYQYNEHMPTKLPQIPHQPPTSRQYDQMQAMAQKKAAKEGINLQKAQSMKGAISSLLKTNRQQKRPIVSYTSTLKQLEVTHAWLLIHLLNSQGTYHSENYIQKIIQSYPKFIPLLLTKIPHNLIPIIWNDPVMRQIASIFSNKQETSTVENFSTKQSDTKRSIPTSDDEPSTSVCNYATVWSRDDNKKKFLPPIRGSKINHPHHVLKFGFREIEVKPSEPSNSISLDESPATSRKRRVYMHLMMSANENLIDRHESVKSQFRQMVKSDYHAASFMPIVAKPPMCH